LFESSEGPIKKVVLGQLLLALTRCFYYVKNQHFDSLIESVSRACKRHGVLIKLGVTEFYG
jgi:hypothetical protein